MRRSTARKDWPSTQKHNVRSSGTHLRKNDFRNLCGVLEKPRVA
jgi:hypothetical protein